MADPKFHQLHYNFVAKRLRNNYPREGDATSDSDLIGKMVARRVVEDIALEFAERFKADNPDFDGPRFLDQCSPDPDIIPLSELWEELE
jgi:hypothetical protein